MKKHFCINWNEIDGFADCFCIQWEYGRIEWWELSVGWMDRDIKERERERMSVRVRVIEQEPPDNKMRRAFHLWHIHSKVYDRISSIDKIKWKLFITMEWNSLGEQITNRAQSSSWSKSFSLSRFLAFSFTATHTHSLSISILFSFVALENNLAVLKNRRH